MSRYHDERDDLPFIVHSELDDIQITPHEFRVYAHVVRVAGKPNQGGCYWQSISNAAKHCGMSEGVYRRSLHRLVDLGLLRAEKRTGRTTRYYVQPKRAWRHDLLKPLSDMTDPPAVSDRGTPITSDRQRESHEENPNKGKNPASVSGSKDGANQSVKASRSEPNREPRRKFDAASMVPPAHVTPSLWDDFVAHRKELKAPLTERAARIILNKLVRARDANDALENAIANGWKGVFPKDLTEEPITQADEPSAPLPVFERGERVRLPDGTIVTVARYSATSNWVHIIDHPHAYRPDELVKEEEDH